MKIFLVRHGQTNENKSNLYYGKLDIDLNEKGREQIKKTAEYLKNISFDKIFISESRRTFQTAEIILSNKINYNIVKDKRINEINFGEFEGKSYEYLLKNYPSECELWKNDWENFIPPNGESYREMYKRVKNFIKDIEKTEYNNVLIVTHSGVIRTFYSYIMDSNLDIFWKFTSHNGDVSTIRYEYGNWFIEEIRHC